MSQVLFSHPNISAYIGLNAWSEAVVITKEPQCNSLISIQIIELLPRLVCSALRMLERLHKSGTNVLFIQQIDRMLYACFFLYQCKQLYSQTMQKYTIPKEIYN